MSDRKVEVLIRGDRRHKFEKQWFRGFPRAVAGRPRTIMDRLNRVQRVLAPTQVMYDLLRQHGLEEIRACKSAYGVSVTNIPRNTDRGRNPTLRVGFIGQLVEHKAPHLLIEAVTSLPPHLNIAADIYGDLSQDPPYAARLQTLANNNPRIRFAGTFPNSKIGEIFSTFDVFVVPSIWYENTPLVIYNSLAAGCPLVVTNLGGMAEPVPAGIAGLHFDRGNVPQLAAHLHRLHDDRPFLRRLAEGTKLPKTIPEYVDELHGHYAFARVMKTGKSF